MNILYIHILVWQIIHQRIFRIKFLHTFVIKYQIVCALYNIQHLVISIKTSFRTNHLSCYHSQIVFLHFILRFNYRSLCILLLFFLFLVVRPYFLSLHPFLKNASKICTDYILLCVYKLVNSSIMTSTTCHPKNYLMCYWFNHTKYSANLTSFLYPILCFFMIAALSKFWAQNHRKA